MEVKQGIWNDLYDRGRRIVADYPVNLRQYQDDLNYLLAAYRTENRQARETPSPPFFAKELKMDEELLIPPSFDPPPKMKLEGVTDRVHVAVSQIQEVYEEACGQYRSLERITASGFDGDDRE